ncbi:MAG: glutamate mutase L, partial [Coriobacteriales bacterium]|nr:glutamate mutase L [Coriobacteriales bacterium]
LTTEAAKRAALGAGAKVIKAYGFELSPENITEIESMRCDIIMLAGGTDGGNKNVILNNAQALADSRIVCPILVCGNQVVKEEIEHILEKGNKRYYSAANVLPEIDRVEVEPAQRVIREIFIEHITKAKGLDKIREFVQKEIVPTPKASLDAAVLLAHGGKTESGIGSLLVVEVGGATINIHSIEQVKPVGTHTIVRGLPESEAKRTVEGDLGIRWNAHTICELVGEDTIARNLSSIYPSIDKSEVKPDELTRYLSENTSCTPQSEYEYNFDVALATSAVDVAVRRHAGTLKRELSVLGEIEVQYGKNLLDVENLIGVGGIFRYGREPERILRAATYSAQDSESLRPVKPKTFLDSAYILYAVGLLSPDHPDKALRIAKAHLKPVDGEL